MSQTPSIVHGDSNLLLGAKVTLGRLDRRVSEQELDLFQIPTRFAAQFCASPAQVMGAEVLNPDLLGATFDDRPDRPVAQGQLAQLAGLRDRSQQRPVGDTGTLSPAIDALLHPDRHRNRTDAPSLPYQIDDRRPALALDDLFELQLGELLAAQAAADQEGEECVVAFADQLFKVRHCEEFLRLVPVEPVPHSGSLLADIGHIGDRGGGLGIQDLVAPRLGDQLADCRELDINGRGGETSLKQLGSVSEQAAPGRAAPR